MEFIQNKVNCPICNKGIEFKSKKSLFYICSSCQTKISKGQTIFVDEKIKLLKDYSKVAVGTIGKYKNKTFEVIGRIQIKYTYGCWNRWCILFLDGQTGWLSELNNNYIVTFEYTIDNFAFIKNNLKIKSSFKEINGFYSFGQIQLNKQYLISGQSYFSTDIISASVEGAEGEVNFNLNNKNIKILQLKRNNIVISIDYSNNEKNPQFYFGEIVKEEELFLSNYRSLKEITKITGENKGKLTPIVCPNCKCSNPKISGETNMIYCISCNSQLEVIEPKVQFIKKGDNKHHQYDTTLQCGKIGELNGNKYIIIGVILKRELSNKKEWVEYLLYQKNGHNLSLSLLEDRTTGEWYMREEMKDISLSRDNDNIKYKNTQFKKINNEPHIGKIIGLWGSFNELITIDEQIIIDDFFAKKNGEYLTISKEIRSINSLNSIHNEIKYKLNKKISTQLILKGFNLTQANLIANNNQLYEYLSKVDDVSNTFNVYKFLFFAIIIVGLLFNLEHGLEKSIIGMIMSLFVLVVILFVGFWGERLILKSKDKNE